MEFNLNVNVIAQLFEVLSQDQVFEVLTHEILKIKKVGWTSSFYKFFLTLVWVEYETSVGNLFTVAIAWAEQISFSQTVFNRRTFKKLLNLSVAFNINCAGVRQQKTFQSISC